MNYHEDTCATHDLFEQTFLFWLDVKHDEMNEQLRGDFFVCYVTRAQN
jgi:hypothetical protein